MDPNVQELDELSWYKHMECNVACKQIALDGVNLGITELGFKGIPIPVIAWG